MDYFVGVLNHLHIIRKHVFSDHFFGIQLFDILFFDAHLVEELLFGHPPLGGAATLSRHFEQVLLHQLGHVQPLVLGVRLRILKMILLHRRQVVHILRPRSSANTRW